MSPTSDIIPDWDGRSDSAEDDAQLDAAWLIGAPSRPRIVDTLISLTFAAAICACALGYLLVR